MTAPPLIFDADTHPGQQRSNNEDRPLAQILWQEGTALLAAIDGVGGYEGGEVAAQIAHDTLIEYLNKTPHGERPQLLREAVAEANNRIYQQAQENLQWSQMSCVLTVAIADSHKQVVHFAHVGDTRLYCFRHGMLNKLTRDHSLVGYREEQGELTEAEAMNHPLRNEIARLVGAENHGPNDPNFIDTSTEPFLPNDLLLLCSDGLTDLITSQQITTILAQNAPLPTKTQALIAAANAAGGHDNITVVLASYAASGKVESEKVESGKIESVEVVELKSEGVRKLEGEELESVGVGKVESGKLKSGEVETEADLAEEKKGRTAASYFLLLGSYLLIALLGAVLLWAWLGRPPLTRSVVNVKATTDSLAAYRDSLRRTQKTLKTTQDSLQLETLLADSLRKTINPHPR